jgi:hypothetical protein
VATSEDFRGRLQGESHGRRHLKLLSTGQDQSTRGRTVSEHLCNVLPAESTRPMAFLLRATTRAYLFLAHVSEKPGVELL